MSRAPTPADRPPELDRPEPATGTASGHSNQAATQNDFIDEGSTNRDPVATPSAPNSTTHNGQTAHGGAGTAPQNALAVAASLADGAGYGRLPIPAAASVAADPAINLMAKQSSQAHHGGGGDGAPKLNYHKAVVQKFRQADSEYQGGQSHDLEVRLLEELSPEAKEGLMRVMKNKRLPWYKSGKNGEDADFIEKTNSGVNPKSAYQAEKFLVFKYKTKEIQGATLANAQKFVEDFKDDDDLYSLRDIVTVSLGAFSPSLHGHRVSITRFTPANYTFEGKLTDQALKQQKITRDGKAWNKVLEKLSPVVTELLDNAESDSLDFRAAFKNQGQYGVQLGFLVFGTPEEAQMVAKEIEGKAYASVKISARVEEQPIEIKSKLLDLQVQTWPAEVTGLLPQHRKDLEALQSQLNLTLTKERYKGQFGSKDSKPVVAVVSDQTGRTVVHLCSARMRRLITTSYKSMHLSGMNTRVCFKGPSDAISKVSIDQRRRVRSLSPPAESASSPALSDKQDVSSNKCDPASVRGDTGVATSRSADASQARAARDGQANMQSKPASWHTPPSRKAAKKNSQTSTEHTAGAKEVQKNVFAKLGCDNGDDGEEDEGEEGEVENTASQKAAAPEGAEASNAAKVHGDDNSPSILDEAAVCPVAHDGAGNSEGIAIEHVDKYAPSGAGQAAAGKKAKMSTSGRSPFHTPIPKLLAHRYAPNPMAVHGDVMQVEEEVEVPLVDMRHARQSSESHGGMTTPLKDTNRSLSASTKGGASTKRKAKPGSGSPCSPELPDPKMSEQAASSVAVLVEQGGHTEHAARSSSKQLRSSDEDSNQAPAPLGGGV